jgi:hypothetical protein
MFDQIEASTLTILTTGGSLLANCACVQQIAVT